MASHEKIFSWVKMGSVQSHKYSFEILQLLRMQRSLHYFFILMFLYSRQTNIKKYVRVQFFFYPSRENSILKKKKNNVKHLIKMW